MPRVRLHWAHLMTVKPSTSSGMSMRMAPQNTHSSLPLMSSFGTGPNLARRRVYSCRRCPKRPKYLEKIFLTGIR